MKSLHKHLFSLTLVLSLISFSGFGLEQQLPHTFKTELIVEPYTQSQLFYANFYDHQNSSELTYTSILPNDTINYLPLEIELYNKRLNKIVNINLDYIKLLSLINATIG